MNAVPPIGAAEWEWPASAIPGNGISRPETKAPKRPHKSDCRFAETVYQRKTPPNRVYLRGFGKSPVARSNQTVMSGTPTEDDQEKSKI
jgi:hypothetical protein